MIDAGRFQDAESAAERLVAETTAESGTDSLENARAIDLLVEALWRNGRGAQARSRDLAERAVRIKQARLGADDLDLSFSLRNLGNTLLAAGEIRQSLRLFERAVATCERASGPLAIDTANSLDELAGSQRQNELNVEARRTLVRSLNIKETSLGPNDRSVARTLEQLALVDQNLANYRSARSLLERSQRIRVAGNPNDIELDGTVELLAAQSLSEGDAQTARQLYQRALAMRQGHLRADHPQIALDLKRLASATREFGDYHEAKALRERALSIAESNFGPNHPGVAEYVHDLANDNQLLGEYATSRLLYERALKIVRSSRGPDDPAIALYSYNLALLHARLGDQSEARRNLDRAIAIWQRVKGRDHPFVALGLSARARGLAEEGKYAQAQALQERVVAIQERSLGVDHVDVAESLTDLARTLQFEGHLGQALELSTRAVHIFERSNAPDVPAFAAVLAGRADLEMARGDLESARRDYERTLAIRSRVVGRAHPDYAEAEAGLAVAWARLGRSKPSIDSALEAEETGRQHLRLTLRSLPERQSLEYAAKRPKGLDLAMSLSSTSDWPANQVFEALIRTRGLVLDEMAARRRASTEESLADVAPLWVALTSARERLANLVVRGPSEQGAQQYVALLEGARREKELAEQALAEKSAAFQNELSHAEVGLNEVRAALPPASALVAFVLYQKTALESAAAAPSQRVVAASSRHAVPSYAAFVIRAGETAVSIVPLGTATRVDGLVSRWREATASGAASPEIEAERSYRTAGVALRRQIWDPISARVGDAKTMFVVPDGALNLVSFATLPSTAGHFVIDDGPVIHYLSAERDLLPGAPTTSGNRGLLALGSAAFDDASLFTGTTAGTRARPTGAVPTSADSAHLRAVCGDLTSMHFELLSGTATEVREVARLWTGSPAQVLQGREANERTFKRAAPGHQVLHLATHGFFLGDDCSRAIGGTRAVGGLTNRTAARMTAGLSDNPLLLSGLALAGANRRAAAGANDDDGILTAEEVAGMNLSGVEWAVLSACDTGLGAVKSGEGVFGLRRAFQVAGARTVIMSLWAVEDQTAVDWMRALYAGRLQKKLSTADAMREASLSVLRARRAKGQSTHPFYWGGFVAVGDWR